jgi:PHD/YefM family antitoxin component YafN of YafNO toxin-antitoxin module
MRQVTPECFAKRLAEFLHVAQDEAVLIMRDGKPSALVLGVERHENYDAEDWDYMTDPEFWRTIQEARKETKTVSLQEVRARLAADEEKERQQRQPLAEKKA